MPSPFPGMDPFLENPGIFPDLHDSLIVYLKAALKPVLPEAYYAATRDRVWIEVSKRYIDPDIHIGRRNGGTMSAKPDGGIAVAVGVEPVVIRVPKEEHREVFLEIYSTRGEDRRLVTCVEILSPANKTPGEHWHELYSQKQQELLATKTHLVEIDLLRAGEHATAVPPAGLEQAGPLDYHVCCH